MDAETGLYYYRARYYSVKLGRFLQTDPIGIKDDLNLYAYVGNDPLDKSDPLGKSGEQCIKQVYESPCHPAPSVATGTHIPGVHTGATGVAAQSAASAKSNSAQSHAPNPYPALTEDDYFSSLAGVYTSVSDVGLEQLGIKSAAAWGIKYGLPSLVSDIPGERGQIISIR